MLCKSCLNKAITKLQADDIIILEYLLVRGAVISQFAISRNEIAKQAKGEEMTLYKCCSSLERLYCFGFIEQQTRVKASKYYITESGKSALLVLDQKTSEVH